YVELMHLDKKFGNGETMLGDDVKDIPPENLFVTEDNYVTPGGIQAAATAGCAEPASSKVPPGNHPLWKVMVGDQTEDATPNRTAIDEFLGCVAALPQDEQKAIAELRISATDSLNGRLYDSPIVSSQPEGSGDFLVQAAAYLSG
ncbi:hypothetical protein MKZ38_001874, partial [Zalerion maritima]